jgi:quinol monooxygenase YgiN
MLRVVATFEAKRGSEQELIDAIRMVTAPTRDEPGCIEYELHRSTEDSTKFAMIETWKDRAALDAHLQTPHIQALFARSAAVLAGPVEIHTFTKVEI